MSKKKYKKGIESLEKQIDVHKNYKKEIKRLEEQLSEKEAKLLPRSKRIKLKK